MKFEEGDKVMVISVDEHDVDLGIRIGDIGTIRDISTNLIDVDLNNVNNYSMNNHQLEKVDDKKEDEGFKYHGTLEIEKREESEEYTNEEIVDRIDEVKDKEEVLEGSILALFSTTELIEEVKRRVKQW